MVGYVGIGAVGSNGHPFGKVADGNGRTNYGVSSGVYDRNGAGTLVSYVGLTGAAPFGARGGI